MDSSLFLHRTDHSLSSLRSAGQRFGSSGSSDEDQGKEQYNSNSGSSNKENNVNIPAWKLPLTSSLIHRHHNYSQNNYQQQSQQNTNNQTSKEKYKDNDDEDRGRESRERERDSINKIRESESESESHLDPDKIQLPKKLSISPELAEDEATAQLIQILLPCIICNRTFSPEALERHSKICTSVNEKNPRRPQRGRFDSSEQRKKDTKLQDFIPPPDLDSNGEFVRAGSRRFRDSFTRGSKSRTSLGKTSTSTSPGPNPLTTSASASLIPTWRKTVTSTTKQPSSLALVEPFESTSEFGSDESQDAISNAGTMSNGGNQKDESTVPHYARALSPTEDCPYCGRSFNPKAYDRHFKFCQELYVRKQYEIQPVPKEKEEALERQELRTKYRTMKSSTSCGSLRGTSPPKDGFTSMMAMKFYGFMNKTFNRKDFKKSNESLAASCYGDYTRGLRKTSPAPSTFSTTSNLHNNMMLSSGVKQYNGLGGFQWSNSTIVPSTRKISPMRVNTSSNIPKRTKSIENVHGNGNGNIMSDKYSHIRSSGYGQHQQTPTQLLQHPMYSLHSNNSLGLGPGLMGGNGFTRNTKMRSSLHKNFRNSPTKEKRVDPEGLENTGTTSTSPNALIITPMNFYSKGKNYNGNITQTQNSHQLNSNSNSVGIQMQQEQEKSSLSHINNSNNNNNNNNNIMNHHHHGEENWMKKGGILFNSDTNYDPYEKAAKQFEELLKSQPIRTNNKQQTRKIGLDRAFQSVTSPVMPEYNPESNSNPNSNSQSTTGGQHNNQNTKNNTNHDIFSNYQPQLTNIKTNQTSNNNPNHDILSNKTRCNPNENVCKTGEGGGGHGKLNSYGDFNSSSNANVNANSNSNNDYWDQVLQNSHFKSSPSSQSTMNDDSQTAVSSDSDHSKSRAVSNISSDSAYRSDAVADLEFEALENLMSIGENTTSGNKERASEHRSTSIFPSVLTQQQQQPPSRIPTIRQSGERETNNHSPTLSSFSNHNHNSKNSYQPDASNGTSNNNDNKNSTLELPSILSSSLQNKSQQNRDSESTNLQKQQQKHDNDTNSLNTSNVVAKFCHVCGFRYHSTAKFCAECGERRIGM